MVYSLKELRSKEVINLNNGEKLGFVDDIEFESETGKVTALMIFGRSGLFGFFGKEDDIILSCSDIELIGKDTILVRYSDIGSCKAQSQKSFFFERIKRT